MYRKISCDYSLAALKGVARSGARYTFNARRRYFCYQKRCGKNLPDMG